MNLNVTNKLIKKTRRWQKKTGLSLFQRAAEHFEQKKKETLFGVIDALKIQPESASNTEPAQSRIIWICWFQGLESAPELVKRCIDSVYKHSNSYKVVIITEDNFSDYVLLPFNIVEKYNLGLIGKAHFSDLLRCCLLYKYGGVWLDSTMFLIHDLPSCFLSNSFCSLRFTSEECSGVISKGFWTTYTLASEKNGYLIGNVMNTLLKYWEKYDSIIDYFLLDYIFCYFFEKDKCSRDIILSQPVLGENRFLLRRNMSNFFSIELTEKFLADHIGIYKLSYKDSYRTADNGKPTLYSQILDDTFRL
ncbi:TPA: capsular polysaccharide synthesis protein [Enterobacter asburiae]|nr:capsular polysaccharide synthesis protein [Enterobacter asburiae]